MKVQSCNHVCNLAERFTEIPHRKFPMNESLSDTVYYVIVNWTFSLREVIKKPVTDIIFPVFRKIFQSSLKSTTIVRSSRCLLIIRHEYFNAIVYNESARILLLSWEKLFLFVKCCCERTAEVLCSVCSWACFTSKEGLTQLFLLLRPTEHISVGEAKKNTFDFSHISLLINLGWLFWFNGFRHVALKLVDNSVLGKILLLNMLLFVEPVVFHA